MPERIKGATRLTWIVVARPSGAPSFHTNRGDVVIVRLIFSISSGLTAGPGTSGSMRIVAPSESDDE